MTAPTTPNPLITFLGYTSIRLNGGEPLSLRERLRVEGIGVVDDRVRLRAILTPGTVDTRVQLVVPHVAEGDYWVNSPDHSAWFGFTPAFDEATEVLLHCDEGVRFAGFSPPLDTTASMYRKTLVNAGTHAFEMRNFRFDEDVADYGDPGMIQLAVPRPIGPGASCRLVWDPSGQRWLVNDGLFSAEILTSDNVPLTSDGEILTYPEVPEL